MDFDPATLFAGLVVSTIGASLFLYGKKQTRVPQLVVGLLLIVLPMLIGNLWWMCGASALAVVGMVIAVRRGL